MDQKPPPDEMLEKASQHPANDWEWNDATEEGFVEWFNDFYGRFSFRCEHFYGDCKVEDEKTREDLMYKWLHAAFVTGHELGRGERSDVQA